MYENFKYLDAVAQKEITNGVFSGSVLSVIHKGETVYLKSFGLADKEKNIPMKTDSIFRLFSMSKPVTAAAAMILIERGLLDTRHLLKWFIPEFSDPVVLDENGERPADRDITIGDLLTMTSGIPYPDGTPAGQKMGALWGEQSEKYLKGEKLLDTVSFAKEMGKRPLMFTPGEKWMYGASADIMGAVIEVVSGMKFGDFLRKEIFEPLGMNDTGFYIPAEKYSRLAQCYEYKDGGNEPFTHFHLCLTDYTVPPAFESGGAGLASTLDDYMKFAQMLMQGGSLNGVRVLSEKTTKYFTSPELMPVSQKVFSEWVGLDGYSYGNLMRVCKNPAQCGYLAMQDEYGWDGWLGVYFANLPNEKTTILMGMQKVDAGTFSMTRKIRNRIVSKL